MVTSLLFEVNLRFIKGALRLAPSSWLNLKLSSSAGGVTTQNHDTNQIGSFQQANSTGNRYPPSFSRIGYPVLNDSFSPLHQSSPIVAVQCREPLGED